MLQKHSIHGLKSVSYRAPLKLLQLSAISRHHLAVCRLRKNYAGQGGGDRKRGVAAGPFGRSVVLCIPGGGRGRPALRLQQVPCLQFAALRPELAYRVPDSN